MIKIAKVAVNDSGKYVVVAVFSDIHNDTDTEKCLQVHHLNVSGKQWICYRFSSENNEISSNPKQTLIVEKLVLNLNFFSTYLEN